jgi:hypothetical protein
MVLTGWELLRRLLPRLGPYAFVEIVLPGGTLFALALYLYRRRLGTSRAAHRSAVCQPPPATLGVRP